MLPYARCVLAVTMMAAAVPLVAQVTIAGDAAFNSEYQARGLTTTNRPVIQSQLLLTVPAGRATLTSGAWASLEAGRYDCPVHHISENAGTRAGIAEWNLWAEAAIPLGRVTVTPGVLSYIFPNREGTTSISNTVEVYATMALDAPLAPAVTYWHDVHAVLGGYAEASVSHTLGRFDLGGTAGWSFGQSFSDGGPMGYYERDGLTHVELSVGTAQHVGALVVSPAAHVVWGTDPTTIMTTPLHTRGAKLWFGTTIAWSRTMGRRANNAAGAGAAAATSTMGPASTAR